MKIRTSAALAGAAGVSALALALAGCSSSTPTPGGTSSSPSGGALPAAAACAAGQDSSSVFALGTFLPLTGSLATLGSAVVAGVGEALSEINAAGGVNGKPACIVATDSGDHSAVATVTVPNAQKLVQAKVSAIIGAESSTTTEDVLSSIIDPAGIVMFSPANTDDALSGASKWYFRDAVPNAIEGSALAQQALADGNTKVAIMAFSDAYGINLRDGIQSSLESNGGKVVYGAKGANQEFSATETNFTSIVQSVLATSPDAIVVDAFDQTTAIVTALAAAGFDMSKLYFVDGNLADYTGTAGFPDVTGSKGTSQGNVPTKDFQDLLSAWYKANEPTGAPITSWTYAAEAYDAVMITAIAAQIAGSNAPADFVKYVMPVTGSEDAFTPTGGKSSVTAVSGATTVTTYADALKAIQGGNKSVVWSGPSGIGPLNSFHDPSSGYVTVFQAKGANLTDSVLSAVKG